MDSNVLGKRGFSLVETGVSLLVIAVVALAVLYSASKIRQSACAQRVIEELNSIAAACTQYYAARGAFPSDISELRLAYLSSQSSNVNCFGNVYRITPSLFDVSVSTMLPSGLVSKINFGSEVVVVPQGSTDLISVTRPMISGIWKLKYEKQNH